MRAMSIAFIVAVVFLSWAGFLLALWAIAVVLWNVSGAVHPDNWP